MQAWEYLILNLGWNDEHKIFYWFDPEYKISDEIQGLQVDYKGIEKRLNDLGKLGWELVNVQSMNHLGTTTLIKYYLKRPIQE